MGMYMKSCQLTTTVIDECQRACDMWGSRMDTVTTTKCVCADREDFIQEATPDDIWVIPKGK